MGSDDYSVRWTGVLKARDESGFYTFYLSVDDYAELYLDSRLVLRCVSAVCVEAVYLSANSTHAFQLDFVDKGGYGYMFFKWQVCNVILHVVFWLSRLELYLYVPIFLVIKSFSF